MENSERRLFEEQWQQAFRGAESTPPEGIWSSLDAHLTKLENGDNKRRIVYYQRLAASLVLICATSLLVAYWQWKSSPSVITTLSIAAAPSVNGKTQEPLASNKGTGGPGIENSVSTKQRQQNASKGTISNVQTPLAPVIPGVVNNSSSQESALVPLATEEFNSIADSSLAFTASGALPEKSAALTEEQEREIARKLLAQIEGEPEKKEEKKSVRPLWASVGASGGSYSPDAASGSPLGSFDLFSKAAASPGTSSLGPPGNSTQPGSQRSSSGTAYSVGLMVGKQLSQRWLLQTGLTYLNRRLDYESNVVMTSNLGSTAFVQDFAGTNGFSSYSVTSPYAIGSSSEFLSIPLQAGFVLAAGRKVGWSVNAGAAADIFLHNTVSDKSGHYNAYTETAGDDASFRTLSWSGLANTELSYRLAEHYHLSLVPGMRFSLTNIVKDEVGSSKPFVLDIGFRLRYIFE